LPAYVIVDIEVHDPARYERYKQLAPPSIAAHGGKYIARGGKVTVLEGEWQPKRCVILEFPSVADAQRWWNSSDYAEAKTLRQQTSTTSMIVVEGL
jgi:uncharacterized protein (DUF1330 family)